jgi:hypothetical protein
MRELDMKSSKVGDKVIQVSRGGYLYGDRYYEAVITKKWPSGRVAIGRQIFNPDGHERGRNRYHGDRLIDFDQSLLDEQSRKLDIQHKRAFLEDYSLWREKLSDKFILEIADRVKAELGAAVDK